MGEDYEVGNSKVSRQSAASFLTKSRRELEEDIKKDQDIIDMMVENNFNKCYLSQLDQEFDSLCQKNSILRIDLLKLVVAPNATITSTAPKPEKSLIEANVSSEISLEISTPYRSSSKYDHLKERYWWCWHMMGDQVDNYEFWSTRVDKKLKEIETLRQENRDLEAKILKMKPAAEEAIIGDQVDDYVFWSTVIPESLKQVNTMCQENHDLQAMKPAAEKSSTEGEKSYYQRLFQVKDDPEVRELLRKGMLIRSKLSEMVAQVDVENKDEIVEHLLKGLSWEGETIKLRLHLCEYFINRKSLSQKVEQLETAAQLI